MHLKSLTLKGFKSFAAPTTLRFEPGITCIVGPNGSGKSNVVDAIAWVLGEQGAKALRGATMSDVIFAGTAGANGTSGRAPLGRAEVTLTIDNADGALPIDYTEVSVSRLLYRSGDSEYSINGTPCRLLDVQELLSDTGIGRELHVIVGQGQLDAVLHARPEERRGFIEEAAGVLKHRKRKEKALRKIDAMQAGLTRLTDLTAELRRQLTPLGKQAEVARRATSIQAGLRDARLRLLADDIVTARTSFEAEVRDEEDVRRRQAEGEAALTAARARESELEQQAAADAPRVNQTQDTWYRLSALQERLRGVATLAGERARHLGEPVDPGRPGRDPEELDAEAAEMRAQEQALNETLTRDREALGEVTARRSRLEQALSAEEKALVTAARAAADRREGLARLAGKVGAQRSRAAAAEEEIGRLQVALEAARERAEQTARELENAAAELPELDEGEVGLDERHEAAETALAAADEKLAALVAQERAAEADRATAAARREALALSLARKDGSGALLTSQLPGVLGSVAALLTVAEGDEAAVAAALGGAADAVAVATVSDAASALEHLAAGELGRAGLMVGGAPAADPSAVAAGADASAAPGAPAGGASAAATSAPGSATAAGGRPALPQGCRWALDSVTAPETLRGAVARRLEAVVLVPDLATGRDLVIRQPQLRAVTPAGDLVGRDWAAGGSASAPSTLETQAAHDDAAAREEDGRHRVEVARQAIAVAKDDRDRCAEGVASALEQLNQSDALVAAVHERLALLGSQVRSAHGEAERLERSRTQAEKARDEALAGLSELEERLTAAEDGSDDQPETSTEQRDSLAAQCTAVRAEEVEARLAVRTGEERARAMAGRADGLARAAENERANRRRIETVREARSRGAARATAVAEVAQLALERLSSGLALATQERDEAAAARTVREGELLAARAASRAAAEVVDQLRDVVHRDEMARTEQRLRIEALEQRAVDELGVEVATLVAEYGPEVPVPSDEEDGEPQLYDRAVQEDRARKFERQLNQLGKINPLAMEEFAALEERHQFLSTQLEDLKNSRRDLLAIVKDVDTRIHEVFASAFADTAREFEIVFNTLFPGGEGRLILTDPDDMLMTGVEVEARPPGKKVKRLSLLSGGERSLTAVALLLAIFRARPSPFYVMDEVEAALDDVNLSRLLEAMEGLRERSQLLVITHQKRTMEIADALYGVTMRGDGVSTVISQRLRERGEEEQRQPVGANA